MNRDPVVIDENHDIGVALSSWQQGDCALGVSGFIFRFKPDRPATPEARSAGNESDLVEIDVPGFVVLSQTCDIQRSVVERPYVEICALIACPEWTTVEEIQKGLRPQYGYVPGVAPQGLIADLDQVMTIEKPLLVSWGRIPGCSSDEDLRAFAAAIGRKFSRFAFPDDFNALISKLLKGIKDKHGKDASDEGNAFRKLREVRVAASPDWSGAQISLYFIFIRNEGENDLDQGTWFQWAHKWLTSVAPLGRYTSIDGVVLPLSKVRADEYVASDRLDLDHLSRTSGIV